MVFLSLLFVVYLFAPIPVRTDPATDLALETIERLGGRYERDEMIPGSPVVAVNLMGVKVRPGDIRKLAALKYLKVLNLQQAKVSETDLKELANLDCRTFT